MTRSWFRSFFGVEVVVRGVMEVEGGVVLVVGCFWAVEFEVGSSA